MKYRKVFKFMVIVITILLAELIADLIFQYGFNNNPARNKYFVTLMGMGMVVLIFYPLLNLMDKWMGKVAEKYLQLGKKLSGRKTGVFIAFIIAFTLLFYGYARHWFGFDPVKDIINRIF